MTLDEAITKYNKLANNDRTCYPEEAQQLAEWLEKLKEYHEIGLTPQMVKDLIKSEKQAHNDAVHNAELLDEYHAIGTAEKCREAAEKQKPKKPIYKHYEDEDKGEPPYIKIACPNGCRIQLYPVTDKNLAHEHVYCPKCGQKIDWSDEE